MIENYSREKLKKTDMVKIKDSYFTHKYYRKKRKTRMDNQFVFEIVNSVSTPTWELVKVILIYIYVVTENIPNSLALRKIVKHFFNNTD